MPEQIKILSSRRAYEFHQDDLRLTVLSTSLVQQQLQELFRFQTSAMGTPSQTFGEVLDTYPPGFVFDMGVLVTSEEQLVPIRFFHLEARRIVIDVAGSSSAITTIFERVKQFFSDLRAPDGAPIIGEPILTRDYSEITARYSFPLEELIAEPYRNLLKRTFPESSDSGNVLIPTFSALFHSPDQELASIPSATDIRAITIALRAGTEPREHIYFSGAPLDSESHLNYLNELEAAFTKSR